MLCRFYSVAHLSHKSSQISLVLLPFHALEFRRFQKLSQSNGLLSKPSHFLWNLVFGCNIFFNGKNDLCSATSSAKIRKSLLRQARIVHRARLMLKDYSAITEHL